MNCEDFTFLIFKNYYKCKSRSSVLGQFLEYFTLALFSSIHSCMHIHTSFFPNDNEVLKFFMLTALFCARASAYLVDRNWDWGETLQLEQFGEMAYCCNLGSCIKLSTYSCFYASYCFLQKFLEVIYFSQDEENPKNFETLN